VVFVVTDGKSNRGPNPAIPAGKLKASGVNMFAAGVTNNIQRSELLSIASSSSQVFHVGSYATLSKVTKVIQGGECTLLPIAGDSQLLWCSGQLKIFPVSLQSACDRNSSRKPYRAKKL
jgi:hypothetical protein